MLVCAPADSDAGSEQMLNSPARRVVWRDDHLSGVPVSFAIFYWSSRFVCKVVCPIRTNIHFLYEYFFIS